MLSVSLVLLISFVTSALPAPATYDQRQTGDLNVEVHLKNVQILALLDSELLDDYTDYDYFYDYADFTIKPTSVKPTTASSTGLSDSSTASSSVSETTEKDVIAQNPEPVPQNSTTVSEPLSESITNRTDVSAPTEIGKVEEALTNSTQTTEEPSDAKSRSNVEVGDLSNVEVDDSPAGEINSQKLSEKPAAQLNRKRCKSGYSPSGKGRCRRVSRRRLSLLPLALKFVEDIQNQKTEDKSR